MPEEFRLEYEGVFGGLDEAVIALLEETESVYRDAPAGGDKRAFAGWVAKQVPAVRPALFGRRYMEGADYARRLVRDTLASLLTENKLAGLLRSIGEEELAAACAGFEQRIGQYLWDATRTPESRAPIGRMLARFPQAPRSVLGTTMEMMQPDLIVARIARFMAQADQPAVMGDLTVEALFAGAPSPECRRDQHMAWVFSQPLPLRAFLDRWRESGRRDTADQRARALLGAAIASDTTEVVETLLAAVPGDGARVCKVIEPVIDRLTQVWKVTPLSAGPREMLAHARKDSTGWSIALLYQAWLHQRTHVFSRYVDSGSTVRTPQVVLPV